MPGRRKARGYVQAIALIPLPPHLDGAKSDPAAAPAVRPGLARPDAAANAPIAALPSSVIARMEEMGLSVTHLYGLTESFAPATVCMWQPALDSMSVEERSAFMARPDEKWGETPHAFVTLKPGAEPVTREAIVAWCRAHMAGFEIPRHVTLGPLPKTSTGKIQKFELRARIAAAG